MLISKRNYVFYIFWCLPELVPKKYENMLFSCLNCGRNVHTIFKCVYKFTGIIMLNGVKPNLFLAECYLCLYNFCLFRAKSHI